MVRNKNYWASGRPYLDEVLVTITPDGQALVSQLEAGGADLIDRAPVRELVRLKADAKYGTLVSTANVNLVNTNLNFAPLANKLVRQALNYALDRKRFVTNAYSGLGEPRAVIWAPGSPAYDQAKANAYAFDIEKAKALMAQAGSPTFEMEMIWNTANPDLRTLAEIYQADLAKIGITARLQPMEAAAYQPYQSDLKYQGVNLTTAPGVDLSPGKTIDLRAISPVNGGATGFKSDRYAELAGRVQVETDPARQKQLYAEVTDLLLDESFSIPVSGNVGVNAVFSSKVQGVRFTKFTGLSYRDAGFSA
jgi:peptide/nickel transport system substrate-binding protein